MTLLITLILTLAGTAPAAQAYLQCQGLHGFGTGEDGPVEVMRADSRGAVIFDALPGEYPCRAWLDTWGWSGTLTIDRDHPRLEIALRKDT